MKVVTIINNPKIQYNRWIIPHISVFEQLLVIDKIKGYNFGKFISQENIDKYNPNVDGFKFKKELMMSKNLAIELLKRTKEVSVKFQDDMITKNNSVKILIQKQRLIDICLIFYMKRNTMAKSSI